MPIPTLWSLDLISVDRFTPVIVAIVVVGWLSACTSPPQLSDERTPATLTGLSKGDQARLLVPARAPPLIAFTDAEIRSVATVARRLTPERLATARGSRFVEVAALPWLRSSPEGIAFLKAKGPRALARGAPDSACPVAAISSPAVQTAEDAAISALSNCVAALKGVPDCGCQLIALNEVVLALRADLSFAPSVSATLISGGGDATRLVADRRSDNAIGEVTLRLVSGLFGVVHLANETAEMTLAERPGEVFTGVREKFGYRRGRIAERLVLTSQNGDEFTLLIGVEYRDISKTEG
jgi:hypothetical protein